jgi:hypothetical protein
MCKFVASTQKRMKGINLTAKAQRARKLHTFSKRNVDAPIKV